MKSQSHVKKTEPIRRSSDRDAWFAQFEPVSDSQLSPRQLAFLQSFRQGHPSAAAGKKDDTLVIYAFEGGRPFSGLMPGE
jgi:hypothetical protein